MKSENRSAIRIHPVSRSVLWISTCTMLLKWVTFVSIMSLWCVQTFLMMVLRLTSKLGFHFQAAVSADFNFIKEPWPVFACNFFKSLLTSIDIAKNKLMPYGLQFWELWHTYMAYSSIKLKSLKPSGRISLISIPIVGGISLSSRIAKKMVLTLTWFLRRLSVFSLCIFQFFCDIPSCIRCETHS